MNPDETHIPQSCLISHYAAKTENSPRTDAPYPVTATIIAPLLVLRRFLVVQTLSAKSKFCYHYLLD
jgi:hypothetical protein